MATPRFEYELLIADDDRQFRETLCGIFEPYFELIEAGSGEEAIAIAQERSIDLALLDMHMRLMTGLEALRIMKQIRALLPCIILTADATDELVRDAEAASAFRVLKKPVRRQELVATVSTALRHAYDDGDLDQLLASA